ncbi:hypothetical protein MOLA814_02593 [Betaproteobacteria bacterium MOLA814]|nr:hypothetical protein MOLA814_02593 [Betaproteobacteria bacterium MOLA814]
MSLIFNYSDFRLFYNIEPDITNCKNTVLLWEKF